MPIAVSVSFLSVNLEKSWVIDFLCYNRGMLIFTAGFTGWAFFMIIQVLLGIGSALSVVSVVGVPCVIPWSLGMCASMVSGMCSGITGLLGGLLECVSIVGLVVLILGTLAGVGVCIIGIPIILVTLFGALAGGDGLLGGLLGEGGEEAGEAGAEAGEAGGGLLESLLGEGGLEEILGLLMGG